MAAGEGRKDTLTARMSGRARDGRLVHFTPAGADVRPGDIVTTTVTGAAPHHLIADGGCAAATGAPAPAMRTQQASAPHRCRPRHARHRRARAASRPRPDVPGDRGDGPNGDFDEFKGDIEAAERRVAREIDPGARALVIAIAVFVLLLTFVLPHTGARQGLGRAGGRRHSDRANGIALPSRVFTWLALVFGVGFSMLALLTRRWALAWIALAGSTVASFTGCSRCGRARRRPRTASRARASG